MQPHATGPRFPHLRRNYSDGPKAKAANPERQIRTAKLRVRAKHPITVAEARQQVRQEFRQRAGDVFASEAGREHPYTAAFLLVATNASAEKTIAKIPLFKMTRENAISAMQTANAQANRKRSTKAGSATKDPHGWDKIHDQIQSQADEVTNPQSGNHGWGAIHDKIQARKGN